jgi:hypothetical protein
MHTRSVSRDVRSLDVAEARSVNLHIRIRFECNVSYLGTNMLPFAITIRPYEQNRSESRLGFDVAGHELLVLLRFSHRFKTKQTDDAHLGDGGLDRGLKKICWLAGVPFAEPLMEILRDNVSSNACEGHRTRAPLLEAKVKLVVLDPRDPASIFLVSECQHSVSPGVGAQRCAVAPTALACPPRWFATAFAIEGFSATHSTRAILVQRCIAHGGSRPSGEKGTKIRVM